MDSRFTCSECMYFFRENVYDPDGSSNGYSVFCCVEPKIHARRPDWVVCPRFEKNQQAEDELIDEALTLPDEEKKE